MHDSVSYCKNKILETNRYCMRKSIYSVQFPEVESPWLSLSSCESLIAEGILVNFMWEIENAPWDSEQERCGKMGSFSITILLTGINQGALGNYIDPFSSLAQMTEPPSKCPHLLNSYAIFQHCHTGDQVPNMWILV